MHESLKRLMSASGENTVAGLSRRLNESPQTITNWGKRGVSHSGAIKAGLLLGTSANWIITGADSAYSAPTKDVDSIDVEEWDDDTPLDDDEVAVPFFKDFELSCGNGNFTQALANETRKLRFSKLTLRRAGIPPNSVFACTASGNSMQPVINDGATVFVNRGNTQVQDGRIYAIDHGGVFKFKYLHRLPMGGLKLSSANSDYIDEILSAEDVKAQGLVILGQAFNVQNWI